MRKRPTRENRVGLFLSPAVWRRSFTRAVRLFHCDLARLIALARQIALAHNIDAGSKSVDGAADVDARKIVNVDGLGVVPIRNQLLDARLSFNM